MLSLPLILAVCIRLFLSVDMNFVSNLSFAVLNESGSNEMIQKIENYGDVVICNSIHELYERVDNLKDETIGVQIKQSGEIISLLSGDESTFTKAVAAQLLNSKEEDLHAKYQTYPVSNIIVQFKNIFIALVMLIAIFIGCTFNAMNIIAEKEDGTIKIYDVIPIRNNQYTFQKIILGFILSVIVAILSAYICLDGGEGVLGISCLIFLGAYISSILGLYIGYMANDLISGIMYIKVVMLFFIAVPLMCFLYFTIEGPAKHILNIIPSYTVFMSLIESLQGIPGDILKYFYLALHCVLLTFFYRILRRTPKTNFPWNNAKSLN